MNTLPFSDIVTAGISSVASLIDKIPAEPDNSAREFIEILKGIVSGDNSLSKYAMANIVGKTVISKDIAYSDNGLRMILDKTDNAGYETQKVEGINAIQMLWQLIDSKGNLVIDGSSEAQRGIGGNLSFIIKNSDGALSKEDGEVFKKAVTELITTILTVFFKSEDPSGENNNITTIDNIDPQNRSALKPEKDIPEKDVDGNNTKPHVTIQPPVKTSNPVNNIDIPIFSPAVNNDKIEITSNKADKTTTPAESALPFQPALKPEKDIPEKDVDGNNTKPHVTIQPPVKTSNPVNNIDIPIFSPAVNIDSPYSIEIIVADNKVDGTEYRYGNTTTTTTNIHPYTEMNTWKTTEAEVSKAVYDDKARGLEPVDLVAPSTEKVDIERIDVADTITRGDNPIYVRLQHNPYRGAQRAVDMDLEERIRDIRIFSEADAVTSTNTKKDYNASSTIVKDRGNLTEEKIGPDSELKKAGDSYAVNNGFYKRDSTVRTANYIQEPLRSDMVQKIENIVEQYSASRRNVDIIIKFRIDDGDVLQVGLKNDGEGILVNITSRNSEIINMFNSQKEIITRSLEDRNIFASIFVNPDGARGQEKREGKQESRRYRQVKAEAEGFSDILKAQA